MAQKKRREFFLFIWFFIILLLWITKQANIIEFKFTSEPKFSMFILAGQSNMAGRGGVKNKTWDGLIPQECNPNPAIFRFNSESKWVKAEEPLHADIDDSKICGIGPGMVFANTIISKDPSIEAIGLIPCAIGGTRIEEWSRGSYLYGKLIKRAEAAARNRRGIIEGILWYQGETDTNCEEDAYFYNLKFEKFVQDLRNDLETPFLPVFQVMLASAEGPFKEKVREAQLKVDLPNVFSVDAEGLPLGSDTLHLTTEAQVQLGKMLAQQFFNFQATIRI